MRDINGILELASKKEINIPPKIEYRIKNTLKNKNQYKYNWRYKVKKIITAFVSIIIIFIGGLSVYATFGGTFSGKPALEWMGIKFSDKYEEYKKTVENQKIIYNETKIDLVSVMCDEGFTVLEFDVKLSEKDKEYLRLGQKVITEADIEIAKERDKEQNTTANYDQMKKYESLENTLTISFNDNLIGEKNEVYGGNNIYNILIDGKGYYVTEFQTASKISDNNYKVYQLYFLTDEQLQGKTNFTITLKANKLENRADNRKFLAEEKIALSNTPNNARSMEIEGEFNINVSKAMALENSKIIENIEKKSSYKNMTISIEKVTITDMQIIMKINREFNNLSLSNLTYTRDENYIGENDYKVFDGNQNQLVSNFFETKRTITYSDGKVEEWATGDIATFKNFQNATMNLTEYLIIEKTDVDILKVVPTLNIFDKDNNYEIKNIEIDEIDVKIK